MESRSKTGREQIENWIRAARNGSLEARGQLLDASRNYLIEAAKRALSDPLRVKCAPSDLVQEAALDVHRDFEHFTGDCQEEYFAWLRKILLNKAAMANRSYEQTNKRQLSREVSLDADSGLHRDVYDDQRSPRSALIRIEKQRQVESAIARLPEDYQTVLLLRSRDHLSFLEIGARIGRSADACGKLWFRAIERLRLELVKQDDHP